MSARAHRIIGGDQTPGVTRRAFLGHGATVGAAGAVLAAWAPTGGGAPAGDTSKTVTLRWGYYAEQPVIDTVKKTLPIFLGKHPNYTTVKNKRNDPDRVELRKF